MTNLSYEEERQQLQKDMELLASYNRLRVNVDFQRLILKGFCEKEVIRLNRSASTEFNPEIRQLKTQAAQAAPVLEAYLARVVNDGETAREKLPELEAIIAEDHSE